MSAVDGRKVTPRRPFSPEYRASMAERNRKINEQYWGFAIPPELRAEATAVIRDWHNRNKGRMPPEVLRAALGLCLLLVMALPALAHDHWISRGGYRDPITGESCCGRDDCRPVASSEVREVEGGYSVQGETVARERRLYSEDGQFWVCRWGGVQKIRCLFITKPGS